jgi:hypothetical protein
MRFPLGRRSTIQTMSPDPVRIEGVPDGAAEVVVRTAAGESRTPVPAGVTDVEAVLPKEK